MLRAEIAELRSQSARTSTRRRALTLLGAAAAGGGAAVLGAGRVSANGAGNTLVIDAVNTGTSSTALVMSSAAIYGLGTFDIGGLGAIPREIDRPALFGYAAGAGHTFTTAIGAYHSHNGRAIVAQSDGDGGIGVFGVTNGAGSAAVYGSASGADASAVHGVGTGTGTIGVRGEADQIGGYLSAPTTASPNTVFAGIEVEGTVGGLGTGYNGIVGIGHQGVFGFGSTGADAVGVGGFGVVGGAFAGYAAALQLFSSSVGAPPVRLGVPQQAGSLETDPSHGLWWCTADGTPGTWQQIAGPGTAGAFHAITPTRVYDSRAAQPGGGRLANGASRTISVADGRDLASGGVTAADLVVPGATSITCNVTVVATSGAGFLTLNPGGVTAVGAASVNWFADGQILNNGTVAAIAADRTLTIVCGGGATASTDVVIDVTGYFR